MRTLIALSLGVACGIFAFTIGAGLAGSMPAAGVIAVAVAAFVAWTCRSRSILPLDETTATRGLRIFSCVATIVALAQLARLAVFIVDPSRPAFSNVPTSDWEVRHSCTSAYFVAARAADRVPNFYADSLYTSPDDDPKSVRKALTIGSFKIDVYEYPPQFLLVPRALRLLVPEFEEFRMVWFGVNAAVLLVAMLALTRAMGPAAGTRALLLSPLVWMAPPTLSTLQKGNVQGLVIAISLIAMTLFERRQWMRGGVLLAYAIVSKLYPGLLIIYLLVRRQWRAVAWTAAIGVVLSVITLLDLGWASYRAFIDHLPGLLGGEAFPAFRNPMAMANNFSVPGLVFKLKLFDVPGMGFAAAKVVGWIYTVVAVWMVVAAARRPIPAGREPLIWLAILIAATLRSPFLPTAYAALPPLMLLVMLGATMAPTRMTVVGVLLGWLALGIAWPVDWPMDPRLLAVISGIPQVVTIGLAFVVLRGAWPAQELREVADD